MWYNEYLLKEWYKNDTIYPYIYMKRSKNEFSIISVYVNNINIIGILKKAIDCLKKDLRWRILKGQFYLRLQIEY